MELVEGRDLKSLFDAGTRFALADTGRIMSELLGALQHAHERGVVHRDIKPANIILLADGSVKVADFGIAKLDTSELTQLGSVLGTVSHMSPEQLTGEAVDRRSDLFSCGVILYQLLTGERAFSGSPATVMHKVLHEQPAPPSSVVAAAAAPARRGGAQGHGQDAGGALSPTPRRSPRRCARRSPAPLLRRRFRRRRTPTPRSCCRAPRLAIARVTGVIARPRSSPASARCCCSRPARPPMSS